MIQIGDRQLRAKIWGRAKYMWSRRSLFTSVTSHGPPMLRDITTSVRLNSDPGPCIRKLNKPILQKTHRRVHFTQEGLFTYLDDLIEAMSTSEIQAERQAAAPRTPNKPTKEPQKPMIGSSSTWGTAELERFQVELGEAAAKHDMIPEEYFDFSSLEDHTQRNSHLKYS